VSVALRFRRVSVRQFRNLAQVDFEPAARLNIISGDNGHGKTSLLEALYVVATSKSFRAEKGVDIVRHGQASAVVVANVEEAGLIREQRAALTTTTRSFSIDGKRPQRLAAFATRTPVVVFHPGDLVLANGPAQARRTLLDRVALFLEPQSGDHRARYTKALRERQRALESRGVGAADLEAYEELAAAHGAALSRARARAAERLTEALVPAFRRMAAPELEIEATFRPGGSEQEEEFRRALREARPADFRRGSASFGPHRDDLEVQIDGRSARRHASQGQQRVLALSLKLAELDCVRQARGADPVLLLDDVSSELDPARFRAVFSFLREAPSQIFVTTPRPELFGAADVDPADRADFVVDQGALRSV